MAGVRTNRMASRGQRPSARVVMIVLILGTAALGVSSVSAKPSVSALRGVPRVVHVSSYDSIRRTNANKPHRERQLSSKNDKKKDKSKGKDKKDKENPKKNKLKDEKRENKSGTDENKSSSNKAPPQQKDSAPVKASTENDKEQGKPAVPMEIAASQTAKKYLPKQPNGKDQVPKEEPAVAAAAPPDQKVAAAEKPNAVPIDALKEEVLKVNEKGAEQNGPETPEKPNAAPIDAPKEEVLKVNAVDAKQNGPETPEKPSTVPIDAPKEKASEVNAQVNAVDAKQNGPETPSKGLGESVQEKEITTPNSEVKQVNNSVATGESSPNEINGGKMPVVATDTAPSELENAKGDGGITDASELTKDNKKTPDNDAKVKTSVNDKLSQDSDQTVRNDAEAASEDKHTGIDEINSSKTAKKAKEKETEGGREEGISEVKTKHESSETAEGDDEDDEDDSETDVKDEHNSSEDKEIMSTCESATLCSECVGDVAAAVETRSNNKQTCTWIEVLAEKGDSGFKCTAVKKTNGFENVKCTDDSSSPSSVGSESRGSSEEGGGSSFRAFYILIIFAGAGAYARKKMVGQNMFLDRHISNGPSGIGSQSQHERGKYQEIAPLSNASDEWGWEDEASSVDMELPPASSFQSHKSVEKEEEDLEMALAMSMSQSPGKSSTLPTPIPTSRAIPKRTTSFGSGTSSSNSRINAATPTISNSTHSSGSLAKPNPPPTRNTSLAKPNPPPTRITSLGKKAAPSAAKKSEKPPQEDDIFASMGLSAKPNFSAKASPPVSGNNWRSAVQATPIPVVSAYSATTGMEDLGSDEGSNWDDDSDLDDLLDD